MYAMYGNALPLRGNRLPLRGNAKLCFALQNLEAIDALKTCGF